MTQTVPLQFVRTGLAHILSDVLQFASQTVVPGTLNAVWVGLFTAGPAWAIGNFLAQYSEATYSGYARKQIVWGSQGIDANLRAEVQGGALQFQPTGNTPSNTIVGVLVCDASTAGNLIAVGMLSSSKILGVTTDVLTIVPRFAVPGVITPVDWGELTGMA